MVESASWSAEDVVVGGAADPTTCTSSAKCTVDEGADGGVGKFSGAFDSDCFCPWLCMLEAGLLSLFGSPVMVLAILSRDNRTQSHSYLASRNSSWLVRIQT